MLPCLWLPTRSNSRWSLFIGKSHKKITIKLELMYLELTGAPWRACVDKGLNLTLDHVDHP